MILRRLPRSRPLLRGVVALAAVCGVAFGVSACEVKPGAAAFVGDDRITESEISPYLIAGGATSTGTDMQTPRAFVLGILVAEQLWTDYLTGANAVPTDAQLAGSREQALAGQSSAAPNETELRAALVQIGIDASFAPVYTRQAELAYFTTQAATAAGVTSQAEFATLIGQKTPKVRLSPRYGTWNTSTLQPESVTPGYLQLSGSSAGA